MEKPPKELLLQHFSHEHLLKHTRALPPKGNFVCSGCKVDILPDKNYYKCKTCPFFLHQVCYNMPQKVQHPVDPNHELVLLAMPSSMDSSIECKACQQYITGFYYSCSQCGNFYHALCLASPLSVRLPVHPHTLKLELLPPYDFQCDLCNKPTYHGWLYHCDLCEFDAHISCALMDRQVKLEMLPETKPLDIDGSIDVDSKTNELMELLSKGMKGTQESSCKENFQTHSHSQDQSTPSYQFSDACFSIDFEKSFPSDGQTSRGAHFQQLQVLESKDASGLTYVIVPKGVVGDLMKSNLAADLAKSSSFGSHIRSPKKSQIPVSSQVWKELGQENEIPKVKAPNDLAGVKYQTKKSDSARSGCSCW